MKKLLSFIVILLAGVVPGKIWAYDHIILRNGQESDVKLYQINDEKIVFGYIGDKTNSRQEIPSKEVYMVYIEKQGNFYLTLEGKRISGESKRADAKKNDVIYLIQGAEIAAENIKITENSIQYSTKSKAKVSGFAGLAGIIGKSDTNEWIVDKSEVFMIRYRSGIIDIITPIEFIEEIVEETDTVVEENIQPQFVVIFHAVAKGETLEKLSSTYNVTPEQIIEWNDLLARTKTTSQLTVGMQLMIYQPKQQ